MKDQLELYKSIFDDAVDAIFIGDKNGNFIMVNNSAEELTGYTKKELLELNMSHLFSIKQLENIPLKYNNLNQNQTITTERDIIRKDGSLLPVEMKSKKLSSGNYQSFMRDISYRKQKEKQLEETEAKIQSIMSSAPVGIGFVNNRILEYVNDHLLNLLGFNEHEVIGKESRIFYESIDEFEKVGELYDKLKISDTASIEARIKRKSGEIIDVVIGLAHIDRTNSASGIIFSVLDITENKKAQNSLAIEKARYKNLFENSPVPLWEEDFKDLFIKMQEIKNSGITDLNEYFENNPDSIFELMRLPKIINVNQATLNLHRAKTKEELYGSLEKIFTKNSIGIFKKEVIAIFDGKTNFEAEGEVKTLDNITRFVDIRLSLHYNHPQSDDNYRALIATTDITERVLAEREAQAQLEKNEVILNTTNDGFIFADELGNIVDVNPAYCQIIGYTEDELKNMNISDLGIPISQEEIENRIKRIIKKGYDTFESVHKTKNGRLVDLAVNISRIHYNNKPYGAIFVRDITLQKSTLNNLNKSREEIGELAQHLQNIREEERHYIAREIHDDLGQALTALKLDTSILLNQLPHADPAIINKLNSMKGLADQTIKTVQKISSELRPGILDDLGLAAALEWETKKFIERTNIECNLKLVPSEISFSEKINITIFRLFQEACTNIARHSKATKVEIKIIKEKSKLYMEIKDNGIGISTEQVNNSKSFGLMGMRERLKNLGGGINFTSQENKGTIVKIVIPFVRGKNENTNR